MMRLSGRFRAALIIGGQGIRARKLRTFLSMISLFLGVLGVVAAQAGQVIAHRALVASTELQMGVDGTQQIYVQSAESTGSIVMDTVAGRDDAVALLSTNAIIGEPDVRPVNEGGAPLDGSGGGWGPTMNCDPQGNCVDPNEGKPSGQAIELRVVALTGDVRQFRPLRLESGQWLDFGGAPSMAPRLVLNEAAAKGFAMYNVPAEMRFQGATANSTPRFTGVVDDGNSNPQAYVRSDELLNWMPIDVLTNPMFGTPELLAAPTATDFVETLRKKVEALGDENTLYINTISAEDMMPGEIQMMRWVFLGVSILVLLIGAAGILNVGLATVGERIEEFALRRAVGTPRLLLAGIVLAETLLTGLLTAMAAIGAGIAGLAAAGKLFGDRQPMLQNVTFPWEAGVAGVAAGLIAGVLGGLVPAARAARIPIATVMRA
ncbi:ABC transporter permease [Actinophytocola algeriensis]|uniref:Putative ABC transport system permease protein n=1 Tax=Actinophytocola algeriensis TaxID=1768010 RepID=A0A7W7PZT9_9PSEU|nr:ABC transporter permease [Actinophytocola algeriensis]MBB4904375.1 putative ABC transport system permease protein [Actinophytocola algeriensis]MBE1476767.1 putative ABC transport system permease protein [Actinophytocola algeriensis]